MLKLETGAVESTDELPDWPAVIDAAGTASAATRKITNNVRCVRFMFFPFNYGGCKLGVNLSPVSPKSPKIPWVYSSASFEGIGGYSSIVSPLSSTIKQMY